MNKWIKAFRLRALPLAISSILMGGFVAYQLGFVAWDILVFALITTLFLQILSNLANDYGDFSKGTDNDNRVGPMRAMQSGMISKQSMKRAIWIVVLLSFSSGIYLVYLSFGLKNLFLSLLFILIGLLAILAAIRYTIGKRAYGYSGYGDLYVFLFFGWVAVIGSYYLISLSFDWIILLPASSMGLFSSAILNLNNLRDHQNDEASGKMTLVVKLGFQKARYYHFALIASGWISFMLFLFLKDSPALVYMIVLSLPFFIRNVLFVFKVKEEYKLDPELKKLALSITLFTILYGFGLFLS